MSAMKSPQNLLPFCLLIITKLTTLVVAHGLLLCKRLACYDDQSIVTVVHKIANHPYADHLNIKLLNKDCHLHCSINVEFTIKAKFKGAPYLMVTINYMPQSHISDCTDMTLTTKGLHSTCCCSPHGKVGVRDIAPLILSYIHDLQW